MLRLTPVTIEPKSSYEFPDFVFARPSGDPPFCMEQRQRDRVMQLFRGGQADLLIATDVAARGLDIEHLSHVVNYDVPAAAEA